MARFKGLKFRKSVPDELIEDTSSSAYRNESDILIDFNFDALREVVGMLRVAKRAIELWPAGRQPRCVNAQVNAPKKVSPDRRPVRSMPSEVRKGVKSVAFESGRLRPAREYHQLTQSEAAKWFVVDERTYKRWEGGKQKGMHRGHHRCFEIFVDRAEHHQSLPPQCATQMSPSTAPQMPS
jgi:hypothetical protein